MVLSWKLTKIGKMNKYLRQYESECSIEAI